MSAQKISKAQQRAVNKYIGRNYDRIELIVPKGQKAVIKAVADSAGESVCTFVRKAIEQRIERLDATPPVSSERTD